MADLGDSETIIPSVFTCTSEQLQVACWYGVTWLPCHKTELLYSFGGDPFPTRPTSLLQACAGGVELFKRSEQLVCHQVHSSSLG